MSASKMDGGNFLQCTEFVAAIEYLKNQKYAIADRCRAGNGNGLSPSGCNQTEVKNLVNFYNYCPQSDIRNSGFQTGDNIVWKNSNAANIQADGDGHTAICTTTQNGASKDCEVMEANFPAPGSGNENGKVQKRNVSSNDSYDGVWRSTPCN
jgi:hypothetical protein